METKWTLQDFILWFENIPTEKWGTKKFKNGDRCCAFGHCGARSNTLETERSAELFEAVGGYENAMILFDVNDGKKPYSHLGTTPKERVVNYLKSLRDENKSTTTQRT